MDNFFEVKININKCSKSRSCTMEMDNCIADNSYAYLDNKRLEMSEEWGTLSSLGF